jgi:hypothetical protein
MGSVDLLGWIASAVFVLSYFCRSRRSQTLVQMLGASLWVGYGVVLGASPVVVANLAVFGAAAWALARRQAATR